MARLRKDDQVVVIAGKDKGQRGKVLRVLVDRDRVVVEGINKVKRHQKPTPKSQGGIFEREMSIHVINVMLIDGKTDKPTRVRSEIKDGKPGPLTPEEWAIMRTHPEIGKRLIERIPFLRGAVPIVYSHHEKWDGSGYPRALKGEDIPLGARIFAVVDAFDAMTFDRPYSKAVPFEAAKAEISRCAGTHFDPAVVRAFLQVPETLLDEIRRRSIEP